MPRIIRLGLLSAGIVFISGCSDDAGPVGPKVSSAESKAMVEAAKGATNSEDALNLAAAAAAREDIAAADREAALRAQQAALKKLAEAAAAGDANAQQVIDRYRGSR